MKINETTGAKGNRAVFFFFFLYVWCVILKKMSGVENETDKKSKLRAIQDWTTERIGDVRYMVNRCIT